MFLGIVGCVVLCCLLLACLRLVIVSSRCGFGYFVWLLDDCCLLAVCLFFWFGVCTDCLGVVLATFALGYLCLFGLFSCLLCLGFVYLVFD